MSDLNTEVIGGRSLRSRRSIAVKKETETPVKTPAKPRVTRTSTAKTPASTSKTTPASKTTTKVAAKTPAKSATKAPAKTPLRTSSRTSTSTRTSVDAPPVRNVRSATETPGKRVTKAAASKIDSANDEILALKKELAQAQLDKREVEKQLEEALDEVIPPVPEVDEQMEVELNEVKAKLENMEKMKIEAENKVADLEHEKKLHSIEAQKWETQLNNFRTSETENMQKTEEESDIAKALKEELAEKENEVNRQKTIISELEAQTAHLVSERGKYGQAIESQIDDLQKRLEKTTINLEKKDQAVSDEIKIKDTLKETYEGKITDAIMKAENWKIEANKRELKAEHYKLQRDQLKEQLKSFQRFNYEKKSEKAAKPEEVSFKTVKKIDDRPRDPRRQKISDKNLNELKKTLEDKENFDSIHINPKMVDVKEVKNLDGKENLKIARDFNFSNPSRCVLKLGQAPPSDAVKAPKKPAAVIKSVKSFDDELKQAQQNKFHNQKVAMEPNSF